MSIADRALAAHEADIEAKELQKAAEIVERRARAFDAISRAADVFGITVTIDALIDVGSSIYSHAGKKWSYTVAVDDDMELWFYWELDFQGKEVLRVSPKAAEQLYWNLPPGETKKSPGGGSYGCHGLTGFHDSRIETLADLGAAITRIRNARELWRKKWEV